MSAQSAEALGKRRRDEPAISEGPIRLRASGRVARLASSGRALDRRSPNGNDMAHVKRPTRAAITVDLHSAPHHGGKAIPFRDAQRMTLRANSG